MFYASKYMHINVCYILVAYATPIPMFSSKFGSTEVEAFGVLKLIIMPMYIASADYSESHIACILTHQGLSHLCIQVLYFKVK